LSKIPWGLYFFLYKESGLLRRRPIRSYFYLRYDQDTICLHFIYPTSAKTSFFSTFFGKADKLADMKGIFYLLLRLYLDPTEKLCNQ